MHFDDRLATVLHHRAAGARAARVQFRQLLDLLGEPGEGGDPGLTRAAFRRLDALAAMIPVAQRERIAGECSARIRNPRLLAWFAGAEPRVASAALASAALDEPQWSTLIPGLPVHARGLLRHRRNLPRGAQELLDRLGVRDRVLPEPQSNGGDALELTADHTAPHAAESFALEIDSVEGEDYVLAPGSRESAPNTADLGALVRRIEAFQRARERRADAAGADAPLLPLEGEASEGRVQAAINAFLFTADETGRIDWAEHAAAPLVVGTMLSASQSDGGRDVARQVAFRGPITEAVIDLNGAERIAGQWIVDAAPRFAPRSGSFSGYVGRFRRIAAQAGDTRAERAADRVRQLLHELRTPVTAIQGFAEVIQQQTVGPVPHEYRALAAEIAGDAARMLAGFAEIERLARLEAGTQDLPEGDCDFPTILRRQVAQLQTVLSPRVSRIEAIWSLEHAAVPLAAESAELLAWRFLGTLAAGVAAGEKMTLQLTATEGVLRLVAQLPAVLAQAPDVFAGDIRTAGGVLATGLFGAGFALRLARAEARAVGGDLVREGRGRMVLSIPMGAADPASEATPHRDAIRTAS